jgi:hypothetical protein
MSPSSLQLPATADTFEKGSMHLTKGRDNKTQLSEMKRHTHPSKRQKNSAIWLPYYFIRTIPALSIANRARPPVYSSRT